MNDLDEKKCPQAALGKGSPNIREQARATTKALQEEFVQGTERTTKLKSEKQRTSGKRSESGLSPPMMLMT